MKNLSLFQLLLAIIQLSNVYSLTRLSTFNTAEMNNLRGGDEINGAYPAKGSNCSIEGPILHDGDILKGTIYLYHIFISSSNGEYTSSSSKVTTLSKFAQLIGNSMYAKIMLGYNDKTHFISSTNYTYKGDYFKTVTGTTLADHDVYTIVETARNSKTGWQTAVRNSLYLVVFSGALTYDSGVAGGTFNTANGWCGFHSNDLKLGSQTYSNNDLIIMPVGDTDQQSDKSGCAGIFNGYGYQSSYKFSGASCTFDSSGKCSLKAPHDPSTDAIISVYVHEIWEAISDTYGAWFRECDGYENADLCNGNYGIVSVSGDSFFGTKINYNLKLGDEHYLVQHNWLRANPYYSGTEKCGISADGTELDENSPSTVAMLVYLFALCALSLCFCYCCYHYFHKRHVNKQRKVAAVGTTSKQGAVVLDGHNDDMIYDHYGNVISHSGHGSNHHHHHQQPQQHQQHQQHAKLNNNYVVASSSSNHRKSKSAAAHASDVVPFDSKNSRY